MLTIYNRVGLPLTNGLITV